jgi:hypothetical protein
MRIKAADTTQQRYPARRNHHSPNLDLEFVPKVKNPVGTSGFRIKNRPRKNMANANINGSIKEIRIGKENLIG